MHIENVWISTCRIFLPRLRQLYIYIERRGAVTCFLDVLFVSSFFLPLLICADAADACI